MDECKPLPHGIFCAGVSLNLVLSLKALKAVKAGPHTASLHISSSSI